MVDRELNIWFAGAFEGAGSVWISKVNGKYGVQVLLGRKLGKETLEFLKSRYGGHIQRKGLVLGGPRARVFVGDVKPHLKRLRGHIALLQEFWETVDYYEANCLPGSTMPVDLEMKRATIWSRMKELNNNRDLPFEA